MQGSPVAKKSWTVMVYMAGDNNLDPEGVEDLKEMKRVGSTDGVNVIAQFDRSQGHVARRYYIKKGGIVTGDAVHSIGEVNTGDPKFLTDFIEWGTTNYPADHYMLVLWNHGQGWDDTDIYADQRHRGIARLASGRVRHAFFSTPVRNLIIPHDENTTRAILLDDNAKDFLDNLEMKEVLLSAAKRLDRKLDILGMDACLMSMAEVGYQIRDGADFTVGSEETEPGAGWPYQPILEALTKKPKLSPRDLSALIVEKYLNSYTKNDGVTYSACDLSKVGVLADAISELAIALIRSLNDVAGRQRIMTARTQVQCYEVADNIDLVDFCELIATDAPAPLASACNNVIEAVKTAYVIKQGYKGEAMRNSNGVAIYFPTKQISPLYPGLDFSKKTGWQEFLNEYKTAIRRR